MSKVDRNNPKRSTASASRYTLFEFERDFPDDAACLDYLMAELYPEGVYCPTCQRVTKHHREKTRPSYSCQFCGHREHPMVGTIFENSATSLRLWFYGMYLMASTRCGISAKQLERELGVTYKTAWRMTNKIRSLLSDEEPAQLSGTVEVDETYIGGKRKGFGSRREAALHRLDSKTTVLGMVQRKGRIHAEVVPDSKRTTLIPAVLENVEPGSTVYTDEHKSYRRLPRYGYEHERVDHSAKVYVSGDVHTNTIEGFWWLLKAGISGVYHGVSPKHLQSYLDEYTFRYNNRDAGGRGVFSAFLGQIRKVDPSEQPA